MRKIFTRAILFHALPPSVIRYFRWCTVSKKKEIMKLWTRGRADKAFNLWIAYHLKRTTTPFPWLLQNPEIVSCYYIGRKV